MNEVSDRTAATASAPIDHELLLIKEAILMVASGHSPRVILAGIHFGEALLDPGRRLAHDAGVQLIPLRRVDNARSDLAIERLER